MELHRPVLMLCTDSKFMHIANAIKKSRETSELSTCRRLQLIHDRNGMYSYNMQIRKGFQGERDNFIRIKRVFWRNVKWQ